MQMYFRDILLFQAHCRICFGIVKEFNHEFLLHREGNNQSEHCFGLYSLVLTAEHCRKEGRKEGKKKEGKKVRKTDINTCFGSPLIDGFFILTGEKGKKKKT